MVLVVCVSVWGCCSLSLCVCDLLIFLLLQECILALDED